MSPPNQQIQDEQQQNCYCYYDDQFQHSAQQLQQQLQQGQLWSHVQQQQQAQNSGQQHIYMQRINNPTQQFLQQQTQNLDQEIIAFDDSLSITATNSPFQKMTNINNNNILAAQYLPPQPPQQHCQLVYAKNNSHTSHSINNNINGLNNPDVNLNVPSLNCGNKNEDLFSAYSYHAMKISQHHFELEQMINMLRHRDNQDRK
ncbi:5182_t:CDS:1 [Entrophospora sp. SA101]|nr:5182_t:CDS:1 [Entrophospora sp. SA101]CAJ0908154.1 19519_t:CDS:1 [Entrophospora sp. SA101]